VTQKFDSEIEAEFVTFLQAKGYPKDSIVFEPTLLAAVDESRIYRPDFAIIDLKRQERLAIIEVSGESQSPQRIADQLAAYQAALVDKSVEYYLVMPSTNGNRQAAFNLYRLSGKGKATLDEVPLDQFPLYSTLVANKIAARKEYLDHEYDQTIDYFKLTCFFLAAGALLIGIADFILGFYQITLLTAERLAVLGATIALIIIPFAAKFKGFGIEYERFVEIRKRQDN